MTVTITGTHGSIHFYGGPFDKGFEELVFVGGELNCVHHEVAKDMVASMIRISRQIGAKVELWKDFT